MNIIREINNKNTEIELTSAELETAYREREKYYKLEDVKLRLFENGKVCSEDVLEQILDSFNKYLDHNDNYWETYWACMDMAIENTLILEKEN